MAELDIPERPEDPGFFDVNQVDNWIRGVFTAKQGALQAIEEAKEMLGLTPEGSAIAKTQELKEDIGVLREYTEPAARATGAGAMEFVGEMTPLFIAPLGGTVPRAMALGGASAAGFFQEDVTESRIDDIAAGAGAGGLFRGLLSSLVKAQTPAKKAAEDAISKLERSSAEKSSFSFPSGMSPETQRVADLFAGGVRSGSRVPGRGALVPAGPRTGTDLVTVGARGGRAPQRSLPAPSKLALPHLPPHVGRRGTPRSSAPSLEATAAASFKSRNAGIAQRKITEALQKIANQLEKRKAALAKAKTPKAKVAAQKLVDKSRADKIAATVVKKSIEARKEAFTAPKFTAPIGPQPLQGEATKKGFRAYIDDKPTTKWDMLQAIRESLPANERGHLTDPAHWTVDNLVDMYNRRVQRSNQGGFLNTDLQGTLSGATLGAVGGGIAGGQASEGDLGGVLAGAAVGAFAGGAAGRALSRRAAKHITEKERKGMREASKAGGEFTAQLSRNKKAKDYTGQAISSALSGAKKIIDGFLGATMTRLEVLVPRIATALKEAEYLQHYRSGEWLRQGDDIFARIDAAPLSDEQRRTFKQLMLNSTSGGKAYLRKLGHDDAALAVQEAEALLKDMGDYLRTVGLGANLRQNYFPRLVRDTSAFENIKEVDTYLSYLANRKGLALTDFEKETAITNVINGALNRKEGGKFARASSNLQKRTVQVDKNNVDAYADLKEGFNDYVESITTQVERRRFFQGQGVKVDDLGPNAENMDSVAARLKDQLKAGDLDEEKLDEVTRLIAHRFGPGEQAPHRAVQDFKNLTYAGLLGNPMSAATQFGDLALSAYRNGIINTVSAAAANIAGRGKLRQLDKQELLGIRNAATDFASRTSTRDVLNWSLKWGGFQGVDRLGKNTFIQSAMLKNQKLSKEDFFTRWKPIFDPDAAPGGPAPRTEKLWSDVQGYQGLTDGNREDLGFMLWNELSDVQPIAISALPEQYLKNPNGRMAYMLQSFTLKLFDVMRKDIVRKIATPGQRKEGIKNAVNLSTLFVSMNGTVEGAKSFITGKDLSPSDIVVNNYLKMLGVNKFMVDQIEREGLGDALLKTIAPPMALPNAVLDPAEALKMTPPFGRLIEPRVSE